MRRVLLLLTIVLAPIGSVASAQSPTSSDAGVPVTDDVGGQAPQDASGPAPIEARVPIPDGADAPVSSPDGAGTRQAERPPVRATVTVQQLVFTSSVGGHFANPVCADGVDFEPSSFARRASAVAQVAQAPSTFVFDTGGLFEPHGVGRFALERDQAMLVSLVQGIGYDALALSSKDLQAARLPLERLAVALRTAEIPIYAHNLRCEDDSVPLCDSVDDARDPLRVVESDGERIALISLIDPAVLVHVAEDNRAHLALDPLTEAIHRRVAEARAAGATMVILVIDNGSGARASGDAIAIAEALPEIDRPDLLVASRAGGDLLYARPASFWPPIAAAPPGGAATVEVRRRPDLVGFEMLVQPLRPVETRLPALDAFVATLGPTYCHDLGDAMPGGHLSSALGREAFADLTAGAMRTRTGAEIGVVNTQMVANGFERASGHALTSSDIHLGLQFDEPVMIATVPGTWIAEAARKIAAHPEVRMVGLAIVNPGATGEAITVNGRPLDTRGRYRIAVPRFLATGGDDVLPRGPEWRATPDHITVRAALLEYLGIEREVDPRSDLVNPAERLEWSFAIASDASFGGASVDDPGSYGDTQFDRADTVLYGTENQLDLVARSTRLSWENQGIVRYRSSRVRDQPAAESDDVISFRTTFTYNQPRVRHPQWYVPVPFGETYVETEFTVPEARTYRHFLVRPTVGARFVLTSVFSVKLQAGGSFELFDRTVDPSPGVGAIASLTPWRFFEAGKRNGTLAGTFDWFFSGLGNAPRHTIRANLDLGIQLNQVFGVSFTNTLFAVNEPGSRFSYVLNSTANLRLRWYVRTQR